MLKLGSEVKANVLQKLGDEISAALTPKRESDRFTSLQLRIGQEERVSVTKSSDTGVIWATHTVGKKPVDNFTLDTNRNVLTHQTQDGSNFEDTGSSAVFLKNLLSKAKPER